MPAVYYPGLFVEEYKYNKIGSENFYARFGKMDILFPCPILKSDPISFSEYVKKPLHIIMQQNPILHELICD
jgi:hypothetical protein